MLRVVFMQSWYKQIHIFELIVITKLGNVKNKNINVSIARGILIFGLSF